jgi:hypothetical protein
VCFADCPDSRFSQNRIVKRCAWFLLFYFILDISEGGGGNNLRQSYFEFSLNIVRIEISFKPQWKGYLLTHLK